MMAAGGQQHEPLLHLNQAGDAAAGPGGAAAAGDGGGGFSWMTALGFAFLTLNSGMAIYRSRGDWDVVAFVAFSYVDLVLLFACLRMFERAPPGSASRWKLKVAVRVLTMGLIVPILFSYKVPILLVWWMAAGAVLGGFFVFLHWRRETTGLLAAFGGSVARCGRRLIADTAATMHAVGDATLLKGLRLFDVPEWVALPNGMVQRILGIGNIEWENFRVPNVYLVEGFQKSLISISQLDRDHGMHSCFGQGRGEIMLTDGTVVGGAILDESDGMYVLRFLEVP